MSSKRHSYCKFTIVEEKEIIKEYLSGDGSTILGKRWECNPSTITNILKAYKIPIRTLKQARRTKISLNENVFKEIDSPEKAYWLGMMYSDGYITKSNSYTNYFAISLKESDKEHLEKFKKFLNYSGNVATYTQVSGYSPGSLYSRLMIGSNTVVKDLEKWGVLENKSDKDLIIPDIDFKDDFIRGIIDGDGSIRTNDSRILRIHGNLKLLESIAEYLGEEHTITPDKTIFSLNFGTSVSKKLLRRLYSNSTIYLQRKYDLAKATFCPLT